MSVNMSGLLFPIVVMKLWLLYAVDSIRITYFGELQAIEDPEQDKDTNRFNDGKCDAKGRFWAGTMSMNNESKAGSLYCLEQGQPVRTMVQGVSTSNGLGWSPDRQTMYYIDTPTRSIDRFDFDLTAGTIQNRTSIIHIPEEFGFPDGMTVDGEGMLWVAHWGGGRVTRWNPHTSELLQQIEVPADQVTSCCLVDRISKSYTLQQHV